MSERDDDDEYSFLWSLISECGMSMVKESESEDLALGCGLGWGLYVGGEEEGERSEMEITI